jgi:hypothetical protein
LPKNRRFRLNVGWRIDSDWFTNYLHNLMAPGGALPRFTKENEGAVID